MHQSETGGKRSQAHSSKQRQQLHKFETLSEEDESAEPLCLIDEVGSVNGVNQPIHVLMSVGGVELCMD